MGEVQHRIGDAQRRPVRRHVAEPDGQLRLRQVGRQRQLDGRIAQDFESVRKRLRVEAERQSVVDALVGRALAGDTGAHPLAAACPGPGRRLEGQRPGLRRSIDEAAGREAEHPVGDRRARPSCLADEAAGGYEPRRRGRLPLLDEGAHHGLAGAAAPVGPFQMPIPPADAFAQEVDRRAGAAVLRIDVRPGADEAEARHLQVLDQARHRVGIGVAPAAHRQDGALDRVPVFADRAVAPIGVAALVGEPQRRPERHGVEALEPALPPVGPDLRVGRPALVGQHDGAPPQVVVEKAAALVVDVVAEAVVCGADRDDGLQRRRAPRRHLQGVEAAPALAHHADGSVAPGLGGDPGDDLEGVVLLLDQIFVVEQAVRVARAAHVDAQRRIARRRDEAVHGVVAAAGAVALAVGDVFQHRRNGLGRAGAPHAGRQTRAVGERNPEVLGDLDVVGPAVVHGASSTHAEPLQDRGLCRVRRAESPTSSRAQRSDREGAVRTGRSRFTGPSAAHGGSGLPRCARNDRSMVPAAASPNEPRVAFRRAKRRAASSRGAAGA